ARTKVKPGAKRTCLLVLLLLAALLAGWGGLWRALDRNARLMFLPGRAPAQWIIYPTPADGPGKLAVELSGEFRRSFFLERPPGPPATLLVCAFRHCSVRI